MLLVSAIVPVYNGAPFLPEALDAALSQTGQSLRIEVVVVDDGSSDGSFELASRYRDEYPEQVRVLRQERGGPARARNHGAREARGEWLAFLDSDDVWLPGKLERQLALARPGTGLIYTDRASFGYGRSVRRLSDEIRLPRGDIFEALMRHNFITASSVLMRRDAFERLGGFCEYIYGAEDWDLWLRFAHDQPVELCPDPLTRYRRHPGGISSDPCALYLAQCKVLARALALPRGEDVDRVALRRALAGIDPDEVELARPFPPARPSDGISLLRALYEQRLLPGAHTLSRGTNRLLRQAAASLLRWRAELPVGPAVPIRVPTGLEGARGRLQRQG